MTKVSRDEQRFDEDLAGEQREADRDREYNRQRFWRDVKRYGRTPPIPPPLPPKKPTAFDPPTKYAERNGG